METDRGEVLRRKVEKNWEIKVKRTWNCKEGTERGRRGREVMTRYEVLWVAWRGRGLSRRDKRK